MQTTQNLPECYREAGSLDLTKNQRLLVGLNIAGLVVLSIAGWIFFRAILWLRSYDVLSNLFRLLTMPTAVNTAVLILAILALTMLYIVVHEAIHGMFFYIFTRSRPKFAFRWSYAYAAAPGWYLPRNAFLATTLAPLVVISTAGFALLWIIPLDGLLAIWFVVTMNAAGSIGDMLVAVWMLYQTPLALIQDLGDAAILYLPKTTSAKISNLAKKK